MQYYIPKKTVVFEEEIKKSRFITIIKHTDGIENARAFWQEMKEQYPDARHHCWAAIAKSPTNSQHYGFSDDGEPQGTAGKPMLNHLLGSDLGEVSCVIIRYFGGIKLGTGGLVRAYGGGISNALKLVEKELKVLREDFILECEYGDLKTIEHFFLNYDAILETPIFTDKVNMQIAINPTEIETVKAELCERFKNRLFLQKVE